MVAIETGKPLVKSWTFWKEVAMALGAGGAWFAQAIDAKTAIGVAIAGALGVAIRAFHTNTGISGIVK